MALAIDGATGGYNTGAGVPNPIISSGGGGKGNLTTTNAGDIIVIAVFTENTNSVGAYPSITGVTVGGAAAARRNQFQWQGNTAFGFGGAAYNNCELWWYYAPGALSSAAISVTVNGNWNDAGTFIAFGVTGFTGTSYQTNPWDDTAAHAAAFFASQSAGTSTQTQLLSASNVATVNSSTLVFACGCTADASTTVPFGSSYAVGPISGTTATDSGVGTSWGTNESNTAILAVEYRVLSATISSASSAFGTGATAGAWGLLTDALAQAGGTALEPTPVPVTQTYVLTSASSSPWKAPEFATNISLGELLGCGGNGQQSSTAHMGGASGGSGCYGYFSNLACVPGQSFNFSIPAAGSQAATWFSSSGTYSADYGRTPASNGTAGVAGATGNCIGLTATAGHAGTALTQTAYYPGAPGPGAPGPQGAGAAGGTVRAAVERGGSGGGAANGGSAGAEAPNTAGGAGALGGNGKGGGNGGAVGAASGGAATAPTAGTGAGGAGGGGDTTGASGGAGAQGADDTVTTGWSGAGPGGGGGGGGATEETGGVGGAGGAGGHGAGGAGGGGGPTNGAGGNGGGGLIRLTVTTFPIVISAPLRPYLRR